jgi:hypothetical protein
MAVKLCAMRSGEKVIANVMDMISQDGVLVGYNLDRPFLVMFAQKKPSDEEQSETEFKIGITPWIPLTRDRIISVPLDEVITQVNPIENLLNIYEKGVYGDGDQTFSSDEQSSSSIPS